MGLFDLFKKKPPKQETLDRLGEDGELPWGWVYHNKDFTEKVQAEYLYFINEYTKNKHDDTLKKYAALKSLLLYIEDTKKLCAKKGECYLFYFENWWAKEEEVKEFVNEFKYMEEHMDELLQEERMLKKLKIDLKRIIQAEPGVKQEQLYKRFSPETKHHISNLLYRMSAEDEITREKSGRSYALYIK